MSKSKSKSIFDTRFTGDSYGGMSIDELDDYLHPEGHDAEAARRRMIQNQNRRSEATPSKSLQQSTEEANKHWRHD